MAPVMPRPPHLVAPVTLACTLLLGGCAVFGISFDRSKSPGTGGRYVGPECEGIELREEVEFAGDKRIVRQSSPQPARVDALPLRVAKAVCGDEVASYPSDGGADVFVQYHHDFDPRRFDHANAALILTLCNKTSSCIAPLGPGSTRDANIGHYRAGQLSYYAEQVDPKAVDAALADAGVGEALRERFLADLEAARVDVRRLVAAIPAVAAPVLVEIPRAAWAERIAEAAKHAELYARFDAVAERALGQRATAVDDPPVLELREIRAAWVDACGDLDCMDRGLGVEVARALFFAHVSRGDALSAQAELGFVDPERPISVARTIEARQREAMSAATEAFRKQASMLDQGLDAGTVRGATVGVQAYDFSNAHPWDLDDVRAIEWASLVPGGARDPRVHGGKLSAKRPKGELVVLEFADEVERYADEACQETNRVERIESDGRLVYAQRCRKTGKTNVYRREFEPIVVPAHEAEGLRVGDQVRAVVGPGTPMAARVLSASRKDKLVQRRDVRR